MDTATQLRALIELAWKNGWKNLAGWELNIDPATLTIYDGISVEDHHDAEAILFDSEFIKALCRAKYGNEKDSLSWLRNDAWDGYYVTHNNYHLMQLAIAEDRIGYLAEQFL